MGQYGHLTNLKFLIQVNIDWHIANSNYTLHRYPKGKHDKSLQAWDSADELVVNYAIEHQDNIKSLLIFNDAFGAINVGLNSIFKTNVTDSYISQQALHQNLSINKLSQDKVNTLTSLEALPNASHAIIKLTKNLGFLEYQLNQITQLDVPCQIIATGKTTQVTSSVLKLFERHFSDVTTSLAKKKSRLIFAHHDGQKATYSQKYPVKVDWPEQGLSLFAYANVFSKEQIDIGGRFLAENLPEIKDNQRIIDLGCGNGLLGLTVLQCAKRNKVKVDLVFADESYMAVKSAELNVEHQFSEALPCCQFIQDDCLTQQDNGSADIILCNPPFHQQNAITEHIAQQMFSDAHRVLKNKGALYVVANRHLPYQGQLKKHFGGFKVHHQNNKFIIYSCFKA